MREKIPRLASSKKIDRENELPGWELEIGLSLPLETDPDALAKSLHRLFENEGLYQVAPTLPQPTSILTTQMHYAHDTDSEDTVKAFSVGIRHADGAINLKAKGEKSTADGIVNRAEVELPLPYKEWSSDSELEVIKQEASRLGVAPDAIYKKKEIQKRKIKIRIENTETRRVYTIGIVTKSNVNKSKVSLEIKYIGQEKTNEYAPSPDAKEGIIREDMRAIQNRIFESRLVSQDG